METKYSFCIELNNFSIIIVSGKDALSFIQRIYTKDVINLHEEKSCFSGYCESNGRVIATTLIWKETDKYQNNNKVIYCIVNKDIVNDLIKRMQLFVLRSDVDIKLFDKKIYGINLSKNDPIILKNSLKNSRFDISKNEFGTWICIPSSQYIRYWLIADDEAVKNFIKHNNSILQIEDNSYKDIWSYNNFLDNLPFIGERNSRLFIAQSINLDLIEAIDFNKGCYPGQEVIARIHYRNKVKYRMNIGYLYNEKKIEDNLIGKDIFINNQNREVKGRIIDFFCFSKKTSLIMELDISFFDKNKQPHFEEINLYTNIEDKDNRVFLL